MTVLSLAAAACAGRLSIAWGRSRPASTPREFVISHVIDAPRELVFEAWIDPGRLVHWWGQSGGTTPLCELDARPGGVMRIHTRCATGARYWIEGVYSEVVEPEWLVYADTCHQEGARIFEALTTVTFHEHGHGGTEVTIHCEPAVDIDPTARQAWCANWAQSLERLRAHLALARE